MKKTVTLATTLLLATAIGCSDRPETSTHESLEKAREKTAEAWTDLKDATFSQREEFTQKMELQLSKMKAKLNELAERAENSTESAQAEARPKLESMREKLTQLENELREAKTAAEPKWESLKEKSRLAYERVKEGFQDLGERIEDPRPANTHQPPSR